ncbi:hypothetical protein QN277_014621 [Acacia crassicarpa]|uniref:Uncharacterized protein n=1 Tax=Acacia crassicarpa TaxID=499986 RepID=A0AAE1MV60_9FABA|nr:hypothetical protein QN277_014621 [Acacia crassicarpa]
MGDTESCSNRGQNSGWNNSRKQNQKVEVFNEVLSRLKELNVSEATDPDFEVELWTHFHRLPARYAVDMNVERAQDVIMHKKLMHMAHDPATRPAVEVRLVQVRSSSGVNSSDSLHSNSQRKVSRQESHNTGNMSIHPAPAFGSSANFELALEASQLKVQSNNGNSKFYTQPMHEITISTSDKPKLLSQLTSLLSETGLNIQEAHAFSTLDGYSLDVFVVCGWPVEETEKLKHVLTKQIQKLEQPSMKKIGSQTAEQEQIRMNFISNNVNLPLCGSVAWEVDASSLKYERKIASGPFFDLYKGVFCNQEVAIKVLKTENLNENMQREFSQEVYILSKLCHKNVVKFLGASTKLPDLFIVTEYMCGGSLYEFLHTQKVVLTLPYLIKVAINVCEGMKYLHQNEIIHRDLKAANLLMDENGVVKVADFGVARVEDESGIMTAETGTYRWMAPEVIEHRPYNHKADVFSFGITMWELLTGKLPHEHLSPLQAAVGVVQKGLRPKIPRQTHPMLVELMNHCWHQNPSLRPEFSEILESLHHFSQDVAGEAATDARRDNV